MQEKLRAYEGVLSPEALLVFASLQGGSVSLPETPPSHRLDWNKFLRLVDRERSALPTYRVLRSETVNSDSDGPRVLRRMAQIWEFKLLHLEQLFRKTAAAYLNAGIQFVVIKGGAAAVAVYDGFRCRPMVDVDLLIAPDDAEVAWRIAQQVGWRWDDVTHPRDAYAEAHHLPPLYDHFGASVALEIHTSLWMPDNPFQFSPADVWQRARTVEWQGLAVQVPCMEHQLMHCCIHFAWSHRLTSHAWRAFSDVRTISKTESFDWDDFVRMATESRADTCCYWTLRLADSFIGIDVPASVLRRLRPPGSRYLHSLLERHYALNLLPDDHEAPSLSVNRKLWELGIRRSKGSTGIHLPGAPAPKGLGARLRHHLHDISSWQRYLVALLGRSRSISL